MRTMRWCALALLTGLLAFPAAADEMQDAMDRANALNLFRQINLQPAQAQQMIPVLKRIQEMVEAYDSSREESLNRFSATLKQARRQLVSGAELSDEMIQALKNYQQQRETERRNFYRTVDTEMKTLAEVLAPDQNQFLDWTPPESVAPEEYLEERLEMQRIAMGRIQEVAQMLDAVKHLDAFNFVTGRGPIVNDYLALYFQPETQQFQQAYQIAIEYSDQVRLISEEQWQAQSLEIASGLVQELGLMPMMDPGQRPGTVSWTSLFRLMTNPQTLAVARGLSR